MGDAPFPVRVLRACLAALPFRTNGGRGDSVRPALPPPRPRPRPLPTLPPFRANGGAVGTLSPRPLTWAASPPSRPPSPLRAQGRRGEPPSPSGRPPPSHLALPYPPSISHSTSHVAPCPPHLSPACHTTAHSLGKEDGDSAGVCVRRGWQWQGEGVRGRWVRGWQWRGHARMGGQGGWGDSRGGGSARACARGGRAGGRGAAGRGRRCTGGGGEGTRKEEGGKAERRGTAGETAHAWEGVCERGGASLSSSIDRLRQKNV
ncbi:hypothetical protein V8E53_013239 [Lactarius tabidus]